MNEDRVVSLRRTGAIDDPLTEILQAGARWLIAQAVEAEFEIFLAGNADLVLPDGRRRVVRHGRDPVRAIQTGIGPVKVHKPKARDCGATPGARMRFISNILPKWARRTKSLDALLPVLYPRGISADDFQEALAALLGTDAPNLSPAVPVDADNVENLAAAGRARWKIENETFNTLKTKGYNLEHNFGHGKNNLSAVLATLNLIAFAIHLAAELADKTWKAAIDVAGSRVRFFNNLRALTAYLLFP